LLAQKQALDEARLAEEIGQAEYKSGADRSAMQRDLAQILANAGLRQRLTDVTGYGQNQTYDIGQQQNLLRALEGLTPLTNPTGMNVTDPVLQAEIAKQYLQMLGFDTQEYADGGEVSMENPTAEGKTAGLDTGDYVFPAEAVRFYGMKTIKAMVEKAMMADDA